MRRTLLFALLGFLAPAIVALLVLGARPGEGGPEEGFDQFENANFPFEFSYPEEFSAASAEGDVPALSLEGPNAITIQRIEPPVSADELPAYVAQLLVDSGATARNVRRSGLDMVTARIPRDVGGAAAESVLYFFAARGGTFQLDCQFTEARRRQVVKACRKVTKTIELKER